MRPCSPDTLSRTHLLNAATVRLDMRKDGYARVETVAWALDGCGCHDGRGRGGVVGCEEGSACGVSGTFPVEVLGRFLRRA